MQQGLVVGSFGRHCLVETPTGERIICHPRGKKSQVVVGDRVDWLASRDEGTIEHVSERRNLFYRQDEIRTKSFAANLDQVLILMAAEPEFSEKQLTRALIAAEAEHITPVIGLNKSDLSAPFSDAWVRLQAYERMGYTLLPLALKQSCSETLLAQLSGKTTLILGPSGVGKSTLINQLVPGALAATNEISQALNSGKHTTTNTTWYWVQAAEGGKPTALIDSPGFQEFGLHHIDPMQLAAYMPDLRSHVAQCKFYNCSHLHEPGCGVMAEVKKAAQGGSISETRYKIYSELFAELNQQPRY